MPSALSGPSAEPFSGGPARQLVVLLHGVGVDGSDLIELAPHMGPMLPDAAFVAPDAPFAYDMAPYGRQWFSLRDRSTPALTAGIHEVRPLVDEFIDQQLAARGLTDENLALVGFSQGTMLSLQLAPRRKKAPAALVGFSGALVDAEGLARDMVSRPRILLVHGAEDSVVNPACLAQAEQALAALGIPVLAEMRPELGHSIDGHGLALAIGFLRQGFGLTDFPEP